MKNNLPSIKKTIIALTITTAFAYILGSIVLILIGFGFQGTLIVVIVSFPLSTFAILYGFYKRFVKFYGLKGEANLFFNGRF